VEAHLRTCPACALASSNLQNVKKAVKHQAPYFNAPADLRRTVKAQLSALVGEPARPFWQWNWLTGATSGLAVACLALLLIVEVGRPSAQQQLAQEIESSHFRSLMGNHLMDVISTDQHTVKPWFTGKLDFAPPVKDLAAQEFPLAGGRLDYVNGRDVAALVFKRHDHKINLFIWPVKESDSAPAPLTPIKGFNLVHWAHGQMDFWAVSDLNEKELLEFAQAYAAAN
jgi:anti-sigma factor RsiW